jgi:UDP-N-acetylmuramate: L-alanyl-gamma-D-glutamyl-meso-diaminopimelate ligase
MLPQAQSFHFLGICGTAMGSVAAMLKDLGYRVSGSDENVYPPMSTFLEEKGIKIMAGYRPENLPQDDTIIVVGNAIRRSNPELEAALDAKRFYLSLPEVLKFYFLRKTHNIVVTGTHGKTTTTSLVSWLFEDAGEKPSYMIGGIPLNFDQGCRKQEGKYWILEGDEYDTAYFDKRSKFNHYLPELLIINNVEFDHADIYDNLAAIQLSFKRVVNIVPRNGMILVNADDPHAIEVTPHAQAPVLEVGFSANAGARIENVRLLPDSSEFEMFGHKFHLPMVGEYNVRNAAMAVAAAHFYQIPIEKIQSGLARFQGVKRRQEIRGERKGITLIDDFGHHPTAIRETLKALHVRYPDRKIWAIFEPRSNTTRRAVFQNDLPDALGHADGIYVAQVASLDQIPPDQRLNPEKVVRDLQSKGKPAFYEPSVDHIIQSLIPRLQSQDIIVIFSNGGFGGIHQKLLDAIGE